MAGDRRRERGNIGIWAALAFTTVGSFMALAVHAGRSYSNRVELQNGADAAALAAAAQLDGTAAGVDAATQAAASFGAQHRTENVSIGIGASDVTVGTWDRASATFTPIAGRTAADLRRILAVQVADARTNLAVPFGPAFLGASSTTSVAASAVAVGGGPCEDECAFPGAFADCLLLDADGNLKCDDRYHVLKNDWQDNLGLTSLDPNKSASVQSIKDALKQCVHTSADTPIPVNNGNPINSVFGSSGNGNNQSGLGVFGSSLPVTVVAPVVHAPNCPSASFCTGVKSQSDPCPNPRFNQDMTIVGYVAIVICYITDSNLKKNADGTYWPPSDWPSSNADCGPAPTQADFDGLTDQQWNGGKYLTQTIFTKQLCNWRDPGNGSHKAGCESFGIWTSRSRLVR